MIQILSGPSAGKELPLSKPLTTLGKPGVQVAVIARRPQGYFITHVEGGSFPVLNGKQLDAQAHPLNDPGSIFLWSIAFSSSGDLLASGGSDYLVTLWEPPNGEILAELSGHTGGVSCVAFNPDGSLLVSGGLDASLRLWSVGTAESTPAGSP